MNHLIDPLDLSIKDINEIVSLAKKIITNPIKYANCCKGKILCTLFYESSTRTRLSFESAMYYLGGNVIGFSNAESSSVSKGESLGDTIKTISKYSDICAIRHPKEGSALIASLNSEIPIINAGDGGHQHPTQTLTDILTISYKMNTLENLTIGLCGDLKFGRTIHSLIKTISRYKNNKFILVSPKELKVPNYIKNYLIENKVSYTECETLNECIQEMDILYMTRVQKERFFNEEDYIRLKDSYILTLDKLKNTKENLSIMHPLPRLNEISTEIDNDKRAHYFDQVEYGKFVRMALILKMLKIDVKEI